MNVEIDRLPKRDRKALEGTIRDLGQIQQVWGNSGALNPSNIVAATLDTLFVVKTPADQMFGRAVTAFRFEDIRSVRADLKRFGSASQVFLSTAGEQAPDELVSFNPIKQISHEARRMSDPNVINLKKRDEAEDLTRFLNERISSVRGTNRDDTQTCPDCAEVIKSQAKVCRYCGYRFPSS